MVLYASQFLYKNMALEHLYYTTAPTNNFKPSMSPALILLHGRGSDELDLLDLASHFNPRFVIVSVRAPHPFSNGGYTWFDLNNAEDGNLNQAFESVRRLIVTIDEIQRQYHIDPNKIFLFGFSMGAIVSLLALLHHPSRFKGIVAHSGLLLAHESMRQTKESLAHLNLCIAHGTEDPVIPIRYARQAQQWFSQTPIHLMYREYPIAHTISQESLEETSSWLQNLISQ